jgi:hypothetical protein
MPAFQVLLTFDDAGNWTAHVPVPNGVTVVHADVSRLLSVALETYTREPFKRIPTIAEVAAIEAERALPPGWAATPAGRNTTTTDGVVTYTRFYQRVGVVDEVYEAPCDAQGNPTAATRAALSAFTDTQAEA